MSFRLTETERRTGILEKINITLPPFADIPEGIRRISADAFSRNPQLAGLHLPDSLEYIDASAFSDCTNLTFISGGKNVKRIEDGAFSGCRRLQDLPALPQVTFIGSEAFSGCAALRELPPFRRLTHLGDHAFSGCCSLQEISLPDSIESIGGQPFLGCRPRSFYIPHTLLQTPGQLGLPDKDGFVLQGSRLTGYTGTASEIRIPAGVRTIDAGVFDSLQLPEEKKVTIHLPGGLRHLGFSRTFSACEMTLPEGFLTQSRLLAPAVGTLLRTQWKEQVTPAELVSLFLFQRGNLRQAAYELLGEEKYALTPEKTGRLILERLAGKGITAKQFSRAFLHAVQWYFLYAPQLPETFAEELGAAAGTAAGGRYPESFVDLVLAAHDVEPAHPDFAALEKTRPGSGRRAKRAVALYLALGAHCELLGEKATPFLLQDAENDAEFLTQAQWDRLVCSVLPAGRQGPDKVQLYPFLRFVRAVPEVKRLLKSLCSTDDLKKMKPLYLNDTDTVLAAMVSAGASDAGILRSYLEAQAASGSTHALCFPAQFAVNAEGERTFVLPQGEAWMTLFYKEGGFHIRNDRTGRECSHIPVCGSAGCMTQASKALYAVVDYLRDLKDWVRHEQERSFLMGTCLAAGAWERVYSDPYLRDLGTGIIWEQDGTFFVWDGRFARNAKGRRIRLADKPVRTAHPFEMTAAERRIWEAVLPEEGRPEFAQFGEPVYTAAEVQPERYMGLSVPAEKLRHLPYELPERRRIKGWNIDLTIGSDAVLTGIVRNPLMYSSIELGRLTIGSLDRTANHMLYLFDLWTLEERVKRDDVSIIKLLPYLDTKKQEGILTAAMDGHAVKVTAALLEILRTRQKDTEEFTLDD